MWKTVTVERLVMITVPNLQYMKPVDIVAPQTCAMIMVAKREVIQRRFNGSVDFYRTWKEYKEGFGNVNTEYWLGNDDIHLLTANGPHRVHIILEGYNGTIKFADYSSFRVGDEGTKYLLNVGGYSGTAGDSFATAANSDVDARVNGMKFTTKDQDNDMSYHSCANNANGGW
ncbi:Fibrinogen-like protein 1,Fibrinogen-like protein A,Ryncolin-2,Angiopoietin-related protein 2,Ryncolin-1,Ryncolin-3,Ficolin-1 [Mytilus coruscus]|uniref:Fibrinogen-like protein 1,Fibrinogen-like protein A,Ryncolin-2,Angiopoietin-related protein 2,Ryncolin-1,Ryncolin-3,Ficolin-1 n=1 Tax=Mytilus coruscus TaxID=42192 RepID=A0A6J8DF87_MYTCO|nr:Fibrinogen-like protein 1,Fibrinogen-like protein A,Ryncolin-2,Angiopoietin-related protein 2,Ryncolin-1,Ryncolin-3,Ficolin-1 [Mytilus coruscus]